MYVKEGLNQEQIAVKIYGRKEMQGYISEVLTGLSKKIGKPITKLYHKSPTTTWEEVDFV